MANFHNRSSVATQINSQHVYGNVMNNYNIEPAASGPIPSFNLGLHLIGAPVIESELFIGRSTDLQEMEKILRPQDVLQEHRRLVLGGMGGIGKTQLAIAYAKRYLRSYDSIFWLNAASEIALKQSIRQMAERVLDAKAFRELDDAEIRLRIIQWLLDNQNTQWLLILDNYDEPDLYDIGKYCPYSGQGSAIITTRLPDQVNGRKLLLKPIQDINHSLDILATRSKRPGVYTDIYARKLATRVQGLPLALATAGAFLYKSTWTFERYLKEYDERWNIHSRRPLQLQEYQDRTLYTTWDISYWRLEKEDTDAARLLKLLAYFDNQYLWFELFSSGIKADTPNWLKDIMTDAANFQDTMRLLIDYSFVEPQLTTQSYSIHTCVHDYISASLNKTVDRSDYRYAFDCIADSIPYGEWDALAHLQYAPLTLHARRLAHERFGEDLDIGPTNHLDKMLVIGGLLQQQVQLNAAERMYSRALAGYEKALGLEHTSTFCVVSYLGKLSHHQGKLAKAEQMFNRALAGLEKALGAEHTLTLDPVDSLGNLYRDQGKLAEAEQMFSRALAGYEIALGPEHTSTFRVVYSLGNLYYDQGKLAEAEQMFNRALAGLEKALGAEHTLTLNSLNSLGNLYRNQGKLAEAEQMYSRALAGFEKALGPGHTSTFGMVFNIGNLYHDQGKLAKAEQMFNRALAGYEKALGAEHILTLDPVNSLGNLYRGQGKLAEAEQMYSRALAGYKKALGAEHTSTLRTTNNLGVLYYDQNKLAKAEQMFNRALAGYEKALGAEHTLTLNPVNSLGVLYRDQGKLAEAEQMYSRALAGFEKALGPEHTSTFRVVYNLGHLYCDQGKLVEAQQLLTRAAIGRQKKLGADHPDTKRAYEKLRLAMTSKQDDRPLQEIQA